jgi:hypothetical protein
MSIPPPSSSLAPPGAGSSTLREFTIPLESESGRLRKRAGDDVLRMSALGAVLEHDGLLQDSLKLALGMLQIGIVEIGSADAKSRFPILRRLSATAVVPREHGVEGWLWTRAGGSAMTFVGDHDKAPNAALLFTKPLAEDHLHSFAPEALGEIAARSPLGSPAVHGLLLRVADTTRAEATFRQFGILRPLTDREVPPTLRRSLPTDRSPDPGLAVDTHARAATSVAPPGMG